jgi:Protein of unknown function (DUF998)
MWPSVRTARWVTVGAVVAFWVLVLVAGAVNPGYQLTRDYVSALASRGAVDAWLGVAALLVLPLAHLAAARVLAPRAPKAAVGLLVTVAAGVVTAADRISCLGGAARCSVAGQLRATDWMDAVHGRAVAAYGVIMVVVLATTAVELWGGAGLRRLAVASAVLAPVSGLLLIASSRMPDSPGGLQRLWLLANTGWLVAVAVAVGGRRE